MVAASLARTPRRVDKRSWSAAAWSCEVRMSEKETTYTESEITERLRGLPGWYLEDGWIRRVYRTDGWPTTLMLVNAIGYCAEAAYHHPDLAVTWGRITVKLSTHSAGGITDKDF